MAIRMDKILKPLQKLMCYIQGGIANNACDVRINPYNEILSVENFA